MDTIGCSAFLEQIGIGSFDWGYLAVGMVILIVFMIVLLILLLVQISKTVKLKKRLDQFLLGKDGASLEQDILKLFDDNQFLKKTVEKNREDISTIFKRLQAVYQKMGLVRYDAFNQMGGQLSYSLALLDENDNGFIINSVHSTEGCYSYSKEVRNGDNSITLSAEEAEALAIAKGKVM
ncbi:MAG: DUF4446 family protein [Lachnospiraceae bacterium]|jgi:hypothetical protein|uniref:DUF4446 family protein n=1 Tax=uncultured Acetatifactor sp. TaxID=1671927 RepID=UPI0026138532|nr:DUF4446 family protein [uncultured Acetatifactor sp.]MCI8790572.1 DUF4446 family protein [Lachnospiraceae bacterium]